MTVTAECEYVCDRNIVYACVWVCERDRQRECAWVNISRESILQLLQNTFDSGR